jgi:hypothetical protein
MRAAILIIGSLLWDSMKARELWRQSRLIVDQAARVRVPIRYGRQSQSRGNTYTMTLAKDAPLGQAVLVPCLAAVSDAAELIGEAAELWKAERPSAELASIGASWGCVGVLFNPQAAPDDRLRAWVDYFQKTASPIPPVDKDGALQILWPVLVTDGTAADAVAR